MNSEFIFTETSGQMRLDVFLLYKQEVKLYLGVCRIFQDYAKCNEVSKCCRKVHFEKSHETDDHI